MTELRWELLLTVLACASFILGFLYKWKQKRWLRKARAGAQLAWLWVRGRYQAWLEKRAKST